MFGLSENELQEEEDDSDNEEDESEEKEEGGEEEGEEEMPNFSLPSVFNKIQRFSLG